MVSETITNRIMELESQKTAFNEAIEAEKIKQSIVDDEYSIQKYFDMYSNADFDDDETRNNIFEYFIDKIYVYNDRIVITWFYSDDKTEISLDKLTEITDDTECSTLTQSAPLTESYNGNHYKAFLFSTKLVLSSYNLICLVQI